VAGRHKREPTNPLTKRKNALRAGVVAVPVSAGLLLAYAPGASAGQQVLPQQGKAETAAQECPARKRTLTQQEWQSLARLTPKERQELARLSAEECQELAGLNQRQRQELAEYAALAAPMSSGGGPVAPRPVPTSRQPTADTEALPRSGPRSARQGTEAVPKQSGPRPEGAVSGTRMSATVGPGRMVYNSGGRVGYRYGPAMFEDAEGLHMYTCSPGSGGPWDFIRYRNPPTAGGTGPLT